VSYTVAEIRGSESRDEVVIIAGESGLWGFGTGARDNGTGINGGAGGRRSALVKSAVKPKRRFACDVRVRRTGTEWIQRHTWRRHG